MNKATVLIVDDDQGIRNYLRDLLTILGYKVIEAGNGVEALEKVVEVVPDLIILDRMMPEMDGLMFAQELRNRNASYPIIACSAAETIHSFAEQISAIGYVEKPFHISQLLNVLSQWMLHHSHSSPL